MLYSHSATTYVFYLLLEHFEEVLLTRRYLAEKQANQFEADGSFVYLRLSQKRAAERLDFDRLPTLAIL